MHLLPSCTLLHSFSPTTTPRPTVLPDIITSASFVTTHEMNTFWQAGMQATCSPACILVPTPSTAPPARAGHSHSRRTPSHRHRTLPYAHGCPWRYCLHMKERSAYQHRLVLFSTSARGVPWAPGLTILATGSPHTRVMQKLFKGSADVFALLTHHGVARYVSEVRIIHQHREERPDGC